MTSQHFSFSSANASELATFLASLPAATRVKVDVDYTTVGWLVPAGARYFPDDKVVVLEFNHG